MLIDGPFTNYLFYSFKKMLNLKHPIFQDWTNRIQFLLLKSVEIRLFSFHSSKLRISVKSERILRTNAQ